MPQKRSRSSSEADLDNDKRRKAAASWADLPTEIKQIVIELACFDSSPDAAALWRTLPHVDTPTLLSLSLVDRVFHCFTRPSQYRQVNVTTVSALRGLHGALLARPELGKAIKSLRVGPVTAQPENWWPIHTQNDRRPPSRGKPFHRLKASLANTELPVMCQPEQAWTVQCRPSDRCRDVFIWKTLQRIQGDLDVDLTRIATGAGGGSLPALEDALKCQATLDLYLLKIRQMEQADPELRQRAQEGSGEIPLQCYNYACGHYPHLAVKGAASRQQRRAPEDAFEVTVAQLLTHIARKGAVTDHLDHPLYFARSGLGRVDFMTLQLGAAFSKYWTEWFFGCIEKNTPLEQEEAAEPVSPLATISSILRWTRQVVSWAPNLDTLSLTSYLEQVFCNEQTLPNLRRLNLGPQHKYLGALTCFAGLRNVQELRLCVGLLSFREAFTIAAEMSSLRRLTWIFIQPNFSGVVPVIIDALNGLLGRDDPASAAAAAAAGSRIHSERPPLDDSKAQKFQRPRDLFVEVMLPDRTLKEVLTCAPSVAIESAWREGGPLPDTQCRIHLRKIEDVYDVPTPSWQPLCEKEHEWWNEFGNEPLVSGASAGLTELGEQVEHAGKSSGSAKRAKTTASESTV